MPLKVLTIFVALFLLQAASSAMGADGQASVQCKLLNGSLEPLWNSKLTYVQKIKEVNRKIERLIIKDASEKIILRQKELARKLKRTRKRLLPLCRENTNVDTPLPTTSPTISIPSTPPGNDHQNTPTPTPTSTSTPTVTSTPTIPYTMSVTPILRQYGTSSSCNPNSPFIRATSGEILQMSGLLNSLRSSPRLLVQSQERFSDLANLRVSDSTLNDYVTRMLLHIDHNLVNEPIPIYTSDSNLLVDARLLERLVLHYGLAYRLTGNGFYLLRAKQALFAAVDDFPTWGLDNSSLHIAASFVVAVSVGKDWLNDSLTVDEKSRVRAALLSKFITPVLNMYRTGCKDAWSCTSGETHFWWLLSGMNISIVSHAASTLAAISIADTDPIVASELLANSVKGLRLGMKYFSPDGAGCEGPDYHGYALQYALYALTSLDSAIGNSFELWNEDGFSSSAEYMMNFGGGYKRAFNFGDATDLGKTYPEIQTICSKFGDHATCAFVHDSLKERAQPGSWTRVEPEAVLYYSSPPSDSELLISSAPSSRMFLSSNEVSFEPPSADGSRNVRVAISGGVNKWNHNDQGDLGSVIAYINDKPLIKDYGYRPTSYYSGNTLGHSTLSFNETLQGSTEKMGVVVYSPNPKEPFAIFKHLGGNSLIDRWARGVQVGPNWFRIRDEFETKNSGTLARWSIQTDVGVSIINSGKSVRLSFSGENYRADILEPSNSAFFFGPINLSSDETLDPSNKRLSIDAIGTGTLQSIDVVFYEDTLGQPTLGLGSLAEWIN